MTLKEENKMDYPTIGCQKAATRFEEVVEAC
jgi:hypothetical protein